MLKNSLYLILAFLLVSGCSTVKVPIDFMHPAEINMQRYNQITIADIKGDIKLSEPFKDRLKSRLVESEKFRVIDRSQMARVEEELKHSQSELVDLKSRAKLGKIISALAFISGKLEGRYLEEIKTEEVTCHKNKEKSLCTQKSREGVYYITGIIDVTDVQTGQVLKSKALSVFKTDRKIAIDETPEGIDKSLLLSSALDEGVDIFIKAVTPWVETRQVPFKKDKNIPELEEGVNFVRIGEMDKAISSFLSAIKTAEMNPKLKAKDIAQIYWNLGLAYQYSFEFDKAIDSFKKGFLMHPDNKFVREQKNAENLRAAKAKLDEQL